MKIFSIELEKIEKNEKFQNIINQKWLKEFLFFNKGIHLELRKANFSHDYPSTHIETLDI